MLLVLVKAAEHRRLVIGLRQARDALLVTDRLCNMLAESLQSLVLTDILELFRILHDPLRFGEQAELLDTFLGERIVREGSRVIDTGG